MEALRTGSTATGACEVVGVSRPTVYRWRDEFPEFASEWDSVKAGVVDRIEAALTARAIDSSDQAAMFLLKAHRPDVYREQSRVEHTGPAGGAVQVEHTHDLSKLSADELRAYLALTKKAEGSDEQ